VFISSNRRPALLLILILVLPLVSALAGNRVLIYGLRQIPFGNDATTYGRAGYGVGGQIIVPVPPLMNLLALVGGVDYTNLLSKTVTVTDPKTLLRVDQETSQAILRLYVGGEIGAHGNGLLRPHAGMNIGLTSYTYSIDVVVPNDYQREQEIRQSLKDESRWVFGYDLSLGLDVNFQSVSVDGGVRYVKSFSVPAQLGAGSERIYPNYFQIYIGVGIPIDTFGK
jgi:opacity protein-like surface antigen